MTRRRRTLIAVIAPVVALALGATTAASPAGDPPSREALPQPTPAPTVTTAPRTAAPLTAAPSTSGPAPTAGATITTTAGPTIDTPPPLGWSACGGGGECSTLVVPLDHDHPEGRHIGVALARHRATDPALRLGSVVLNPGGPGASGVLNLAKDLSVLPAGVVARFDVVAFDPRGVGRSEAIRCTGDTYRGPEPDPVPPTMAAAAPLLAADRAYAAACAAGSGDLLAHVGTLDVARDLESLRQALGDPGLTYLGLSYGTLLGATYASLFPTHVRAMVLDGAIDPALPTDALADAQAQGFERSLDAFFSWCGSNPGSCAWRPAGEAHAAFRQLAATVRAHPLAVGARTVGPSEYYTGAFATLYARSFWPSLGRALAAVARGDGGPILGLYDGYEGANDPAFSVDANNAVTCLDHPVPVDPSAYPERARVAAASAPDFGPLFAWGALSCAVWPVPATSQRRPGAISAPGSGPILVVGTTEDPATPYAWAKSLAAHLQHGSLLTRVGVDHVAIFYSSCVRAADQAVLVDGRLPAPGTVCSS